MDWVVLGDRWMSFIKKYRFIIFAVVAGFLLINVPGKGSSIENTLNTEVEIQSHPSLEDSLAQILGMLKGAGRVEVLLTEDQSEEIVYQTDEKLSSNDHSQDIDRDTVMISQDNRTETGLIRQHKGPIYRGAVVICEGADNAAVRFSVVEAVMSVTGLTSDKITVLKMK